jgi:D-apiose dehydrogenase
MKILKGGVIGCGFFAINHLHGWRDARGAEIVALCDNNAERLNQVGDQFGIVNRYRDAAEMLAKEDLDFVDIATTISSHRALVELAAKHRTPAICQKPFASNLVDARAMVLACEQAGVPLMVHENFRWQSPIQAVKRVLLSGEIGKPFWGRVSFRSAYDVFSGQPYLAESERFIVEDLGIHALDIARFLFGEVKSLAATTARINPRIKGEDVATVLLDHAIGLTSIVDCSYASHLEEECFPQTLVEIDGAVGSLRLSSGYQLAITTKQTTRHVDVSPPLLPWASKPWHNIQESVAIIEQHWADCLLQSKEPQTSGRDNFNTMSLVDAVYRSAGNASRIEPTRID